MVMEYLTIYFPSHALFVKITMPRNIFKSAQKTVNFYLLLITAVSVFFSIGILALMYCACYQEKLIL